MDSYAVKFGKLPEELSPPIDATTSSDSDACLPVSSSSSSKSIASSCCAKANASKKCAVSRVLGPFMRKKEPKENERAAIVTKQQAGDLEPAAVVLYNDEIHTFDEVNTCLTQAIHCTQEAATEFAATIDREVCFYSLNLLLIYKSTQRLFSCICFVKCRFCCINN